MDGERKESTRVFDSNLAAEIGLNEAIVLSQLCYWISLNEKAGRNFHDGRYWTYNTFEQWQEQFPFWSVRTIKTIFSNLRELGLITVGNHNKSNIDRTNWYAVNEEALSRLCNSCTMDSDNPALPIPENNSKEYRKEKRDRVLSAERSEPTTVSNPHVETIEPDKKITRQKCIELFGEKATSDAKRIVDEYIDHDYPYYRRKEHPRVTHAARYAYAYRILRCAAELYYSDLEFVREAILCAVEYERDYDPKIYLVTRPHAICHWLLESGIGGAETTNMDRYGFNDKRDDESIPFDESLAEYFKQNYQ